MSRHNQKLIQSIALALFRSNIEIDDINYIFALSQEI